MLHTSVLYLPMFAGVQFFAGKVGFASFWFRFLGGFLLNFFFFFPDSCLRHCSAGQLDTNIFLINSSEC